MAKNGWNFGTPRRGQEIVHYRDARIEREGKTYTANYDVDDDGQLVVSSDWGSVSAPDKGPKIRAALAEKLLGDMIDKWLAGR